jgi:Glycosyl transferase family 11
MVTIKLGGGLGNQMFQYALGRAVASRRSDELCLDISSFKSGRTLRDFSLDVFNIQAPVADGSRNQEPHLRCTLSEQGFGFMPEIFDECMCHDNIRLRGWWQSERYFSHISASVRQEFSFKPGFTSSHNLALVKQVHETESVCVHIRRTDYLRKDDSRGFVGVDYYSRALETMMSQVRRPCIFVFSDDVQWCRHNFHAECAVIYASSEDAPKRHPADDFFLMRQCKHHIIANSTYSWWAAWLSNDSAKRVVAPRRWFRSEEAGVDHWKSEPSSASLIPITWTRT